MSLISRASALLACLAAAGCGGGSGGADAGPAAATLGTGDVEFVPLEDGDEIQIVQGPQGGYHFFGSVRVTGIEPGDPDDLGDPDNPTTEFRVWQGGARVDVGAATFTQGLEEGPSPGVYEMIGRLVILDILDDAELAGAEVRMEVEVAGAGGASVTSARDLVAVPHPANR